MGLLFKVQCLPRDSVCIVGMRWVGTTCPIQSSHVFSQGINESERLGRSRHPKLHRCIAPGREMAATNIRSTIRVVFLARNRMRFPSKGDYGLVLNEFLWRRAVLGKHTDSWTEVRRSCFLAFALLRRHWWLNTWGDALSGPTTRRRPWRTWARSWHPEGCLDEKSVPRPFRMSELKLHLHPKALLASVRWTRTSGDNNTVRSVCPLKCRVEFCFSCTKNGNSTSQWCLPKSWGYP